MGPEGQYYIAKEREEAGKLADTCLYLLLDRCYNSLICGIICIKMAMIILIVG